jgi:hypothetical protein
VVYHSMDVFLSIPKGLHDTRSLSFCDPDIDLGEDLKKLRGLIILYNCEKQRTEYIVVE